MLTFSLVAAACVAAALAFLLPPLLRRSRRAQVTSESANVSIYRDQLVELKTDLDKGTLSRDQYDQSRAEIEDRLAEDLRAAESAVASEGRSGKWIAVSLAVALPLAAIGLYALLGTPAALDPVKRLGMTQEEAAERQKMVDLTERLAQRMRQQPEDPKGWKMLGRAYRALGKMREAAAALEKGIAADPKDPSGYVDLAETLAMIEGGRVQGDAAGLAARALALDPKNEKALALLGTAAFESRDFAGAVRYWERLRTLAPDGSDFAKAIDGGIAEARAAMAQTPPKASDGKEGITGTVEVAGALSTKLPAEATVFIFARPVEGPRMPLAVMRAAVKDLPVKFRLDDSMGMGTGAKLSSQSQVVVAARISLTGSATPSAGDLEGSSSPVKPGTKGVRVVIDRQVP